MSRIPRIIPALGAVFLASVAIAACGDSVPGNAVARVKDDTISKKDFEKWLLVAAKASQPQGGAAAKVSIPDAPDFKVCIAAKQKAAPKPVTGQPKPTVAQFKTQCKTEYDGLKDQVMSFLISSEWIQGEAKELGVDVSDAEVRKAFATQKTQSFPKEADYKKFLKSSGMTQEDLLFRVKLDTLSNKIRTKVTKSKGKATPAQISAYYNKNKAQFAQPETRDLLIVQTKTEAQANAAKAALEGGQSFASVAKASSIDQATKNTGGKLAGVQQGQQEKALDDAAFKAKPGVVTGPVKTSFGYYVFKVEKITPKTQQTLAQATPTIKQLLASQNQQKALDTFVKDFQKKWKERTDCRKGYIVESCKNAPKPKKGQTTVPPGGAPQQAPQQAPTQP